MRILKPSKRTVDFTRKLPAKQYKQVMGAVMDLLQNPTPYDSKTLEGYKNLYRKDVGEFRIIYRFDADIVYLILVGKRNDDEVYKLLRQLL